ncbi:MAG: HAMP domain-containing histidine kinase [Alkaliphilus sp.]|nr:HAMP domain-containing histidine kinase [Alkaliphilus sp.]
MTVKRQWMLVLILSGALSVAVNSIVLSTLINNYFIDYSTENYNRNVSQLVVFSEKTLVETGYSEQQIKMQLETYLSDPIKRIRLYDINGNLLADVGSEGHQIMGMMRNKMMNRMMGNASEEVDSVDIMNDGVAIGQLNITRYSSIGNSLETRKFAVSLIGSSFLSFGIVFVLIFIIGIFISKKMSKDLRLTAQQAIDIDLGNQNNILKSNVEEIRIIQQSLETLQTRLKLKQISRKKLVDELIHQTRTPLTILKTHLEGFEDGIIRFTPEEIRICEAQIENITSIIANMSGMIDAEKDIDAVNIEQVELNRLLKQIVGGLKVQFDRKTLELELLSHQKVFLKTDQYKLSQVIYNILTNAYKFTNSNGRVTVEYKQAEDELIIIIQDTGSGITEEERSRIFDAYYRGKNSGHTSGEGIGLYVAKENLKKINGKIDVESEPGVGSKFIINIHK